MPASFQANFTALAAGLRHAGHPDIDRLMVSGPAVAMPAFSISDKRGACGVPVTPVNTQPARILAITQCGWYACTASSLLRRNSHVPLLPSGVHSPFFVFQLLQCGAVTALMHWRMLIQQSQSRIFVRWRIC